MLRFNWNQHPILHQTLKMGDNILGLTANKTYGWDACLVKELQKTPLWFGGQGVFCILSIVSRFTGYDNGIRRPCIFGVEEK